MKPHMEYEVHALCPWTLGDKISLRMFKRGQQLSMVTNLKDRNCKERLAELGMTTLEDRRRRGDLIQMYRVMAGKDRVNPFTWFTPTQERQGAMSTRLITGFHNVEKLRGNTEVRKNFWAVRVVDSWNSLQML